MKLNVHSVDSRVCVQLHFIEHKLQSNHDLFMNFLLISNSYNLDSTGESVTTASINSAVLPDESCGAFLVSGTRSTKTVLTTTCDTRENA